jgi:hypothetical protein
MYRTGMVLRMYRLVFVAIELFSFSHSAKMIPKKTAIKFFHNVSQSNVTSATSVTQPTPERPYDVSRGQNGYARLLNTVNNLHRFPAYIKPAPSANCLSGWTRFSVPPNTTRPVKAFMA